jgi:hypothetical protein
MPASRDQLERLRSVSEAENPQHLDVLAKVIPELAPESCGAEEFAELLGVLERAPTSDGFESYWSIVHFLEACEGYEPSLLQSIERQPSELSLAMVNRLLNVGTTHIGATSLLGILGSVAGRTDALEQLRETARGFIAYQRAKKHDV